MTYKQAQALARSHGMTLRKTSTGDYRVNFKGGSEAQALYEETIIDAVLTAEHMHMARNK